MSPRRALGRRRRKAAAAVDEQPVLMQIRGPDLGRRHAVDGERLVLGSSDGAGLRLELEAVEPEHAELERVGGQVVIRDRRSRAGTYVNDRRIDELELEHGDRVQLGRALLRFFSHDVSNACDEEQRRLAGEDGLTGLYNRRAFRDQLSAELSRCKRYGRELSVLVYGPDEVGRLERMLGPVVLDALLVELVDLVGQFLSRNDFHARYGEQEFAVILPEVNQARALMQAERIRRAVEQTELQPHGQPLPVTISVGVATFERDMEDAGDFIAEIDRNLYQSTKAGRNRVIGVEGGVTRCS